MAISNSASPELLWGLGGPEEDHQRHHCCWTGRVGQREEEESHIVQKSHTSELKVSFSPNINIKLTVLSTIYVHVVTTMVHSLTI